MHVGLWSTWSRLKGKNVSIVNSANFLRNDFRGGQKGPNSLKSVTHILQWWDLAQLYLT